MLHVCHLGREACQCGRGIDEDAGERTLLARLNGESLRWLQAAENLHAAGFPDQAEQLMRQVERMKHEAQGPRPEPRPEPPHEPELHAHVRELTEHVRHLNERIERLEEMIERLARERR